MSSAAESFRNNVSPQDLVQAVLRQTEAGFLRDYGAAPFLAIRVDGDAASVAAGLDATLTHEGRFARPVVGAMSFHTEMATARQLGMMATSTRSTAASSAAALARTLSAAPHYLVSLKKRKDVDAAFAERVSVGRAPNKDVVLRHSSISKFHAWFQFDEASDAYVADAGSKNGTLRNGQRLPPREPVLVTSGDVITFGHVQALVCDARDIWHAIQGAS